jgi:hypothetical protein
MVEAAQALRGAVESVWIWALDATSAKEYFVV